MITAINSLNKISQATRPQKIAREFAYRATGTLNNVIDNGTKKAEAVINEIIENASIKKPKAKSNKFINGIKNGWNKVKEFSKNAWKKTKEFAVTAWEWTKEKFGKVKEFFTRKKDVKPQ